MRVKRIAFVAAAMLGLSGLTGVGASPASATLHGAWSSIASIARGQSVNLWMWGGDPQGNAYVDNYLVPAAKANGVTLRRVPIADTKDALNRILSEKSAGKKRGSVDLVWVNGDNFRAGQKAKIWLCNWTRKLPSIVSTNIKDPLLNSDFGAPVNGCEAPWSKAQFSIVYDSARVTPPPTTIDELLTWIAAHPGRFTYPAPPDFTGSVFVRELLRHSMGNHNSVPPEFSQTLFNQSSAKLWKSLKTLRPSLWRQGDSYPKDSSQLDSLFAGGQVDFTMTYGPATLTSLVERGVFPPTTQILKLTDGTVGNASFLAIPTTSTNKEGAMVIANLALSVKQQIIKADPRVWGQFPVFALSLLTQSQLISLDKLPKSTVVPSYDQLSKNAHGEFSSGWVAPLDAGWRINVLAAPQ